MDVRRCFQLVNYTANLTEERDELNQALEEAKKALQREMAARIALESKGQLQQGRKVRPLALSTVLVCSKSYVFMCVSPVRFYCTMLYCAGHIRSFSFAGLPLEGRSNIPRTVLFTRVRLASLPNQAPLS